MSESTELNLSQRALKFCKRSVLFRANWDGFWAKWVRRAWYILVAYKAISDLWIQPESIYHMGNFLKVSWPWLLLLGAVIAVIAAIEYLGTELSELKSNLNDELSELKSNLNDELSELKASLHGEDGIEERIRSEFAQDMKNHKSTWDNDLIEQKNELLDRTAVMERARDSLVATHCRDLIDSQIKALDSGEATDDTYLTGIDEALNHNLPKRFMQNMKNQSRGEPCSDSLQARIRNKRAFLVALRERMNSEAKRWLGDG